MDNILETKIGKDILSVILTFFTKNEKYYYRNKWNLIKKPIQFGITYGKLDILQKMKNSGVPFTEDDMFNPIIAMENGNFKIAKWLLQNGCPCDYECYANAICDYRSPKMVKCLYENEFDWEHVGNVGNVGNVGDYFTGKRVKVGVECMKDALYYYCLDIAKYLYANKLIENMK